MATTTQPNARIIDLGAEHVSTCELTDSEGWPAGECPENARYVVVHLPNGTSPTPTIGGSHPSLCHEHARELIARCLKWQCRGAR